MPWEQTENEIAHRLRNPAGYVRLRRKKLTKGVSAIIGFKQDGGSEIQALRFDKAVFDMATAKAWMAKRKHKFAETQDIADQLGPDEIEIFRAGDHRPFGGKLYTEDDVAEMVATYDPVNEHEAPITLDHKGDDGGDSYGWAANLRQVGRSLIAKMKQVSPELRAAFHEGRYKRVSAEVYPDYKGTGKKYLRAVTFVGAMIPKVKGLALAKFAEDAGPYVSVDLHADPGQPYEPVDLEAAVTEQETMRRLSNLIYQFTTTVEKVLCAPNLDAGQKRTEIKRLASQFDELVGADVEGMAERESAARGGGEGTMTDKPEKGEVQKMVDDAVAAATQKHAEERKVLEDRVKMAEDNAVKLGVEVQTVRRQANLEKLTTFAENWTRAGLVSPASRAKGLVAFCEAVIGIEIEMPKADGTPEKVNGLTWFAEFLKDRPASVAVGEHDGARGSESPLDSLDVTKLIGGVDGSSSRLQQFVMPDGADKASAMFAEKARLLAAERKITFAEAAEHLDRATGFYKRT